MRKIHWIHRRAPRRYLTVSDMNADLHRWSADFGSDIDLVVGIPRSGLLAASILGCYLHRPVVDITTFLSGHAPWRGYRLGEKLNDVQKVLVLDDSIRSGFEMRRVREALSDHAEQYELIFGAVYAEAGAENFVDTYCKVVPSPRMFEWNVLQHPGLLAATVMDVEGVLCAPRERLRERMHIADDAYWSTVLGSEPTYRPGTLVHTLVAQCDSDDKVRLVDWLKRHHIMYNNLVAINGEMSGGSLSALSQRVIEAKSKAYESSDAELYVCGTANQAEAIRVETEKPVYRYADHAFIPGVDDPEDLYLREYLGKQQLRDRLRRRIKRLFGCGELAH